MKFDFWSLKSAALMGSVSGLLLGSVAMYRLHADPPEIDKYPTVAEILRPNVAWPTYVTLLKDQRVLVKKKGIPVGRVVINAGVTLKAIDLTKDGSVVVLFTDHTLDIPLEDTDLFERSITGPAFQRAMEPYKLGKLEEAN